MSKIIKIHQDSWSVNISDRAFATRLLSAPPLLRHLDLGLCTSCWWPGRAGGVAEMCRGEDRSQCGLLWHRRSSLAEGRLGQEEGKPRGIILGVGWFHPEDFLYEYAMCIHMYILWVPGTWNGGIQLVADVYDISPTSSQAKLPRLCIGNAVAAEALLQEMSDSRTG